MDAPTGRRTRNQQRPSRARRGRPRVVTVFGTRPQFIKLAALWKSLEAAFDSVLIDSGQHYDWNLSGVFRTEAGVRQPDDHLEIGSAPAASQIGRIADSLDGRLAKLAPDAVLVIGDTSTTVGAAIAAAYRGIPLGHIEAGLRSFDQSAPEEKNRIIADHLATWRFCPTRTAIAHLKAEGIARGVFGTGDLMYERWLEWRHDQRLASRADSPDAYYLATVHRAENVDDHASLKKLLAILRNLDAPVVFPIHPRTRNTLQKHRLWGTLTRMKHLRMLNPISHGETLRYTVSARAVLTDSGGLQREAYWCGVPCVILRARTEWMELIRAGAGVLTGLDHRLVQRALSHPRRCRLVADPVFRQRRPSVNIIRILARELAAG